MQITLQFNEAVNGTKKVTAELFRLFNIIKNQYVELVKDQNQSLELNLKNVEHVKAQDL